MKCELCAALLHRPKVLFLDEPTIGLDVSMQARIREFIRDLQRAARGHRHADQPLHGRRGRALPAHHRHRQGHLVYDGDLKELARRIRPEKRITLRLARPRAPRSWPGGDVVSQTDGGAVLTVPAERLNDALRDVLGALPVIDLSVEDPPLEEVMREVFQQSRATRRASKESAG
jgi:ABC-2 type transport system ATP-binding protein